MTLKALEKSESADAILVSFDAKWTAPLNEGSVSKVFRKRGPKSTLPKWIYVYLGVPTKAIVGRLSIIELRHLSLVDALKHAAEGALQITELRNYAIGYESLFVFTVGTFEPASESVALSVLKTNYGFSPPQSFLVLSHQGQQILDRLCGFQKGDAR